MHRLLLLLGALAGCSGNAPPTDAADSGDSAADSGDTGDSAADSGDTGDTAADSGDTGDTAADSGDTGDSAADSGDTGDSGDSAADSGDTGDTATDSGDTGDTAADSGDTAPRDDDGDGWTTARDCDDGDAAVHPYADELCDGVDNNCDGVVDEGMPTWYADRDADGYGDASDAVTACAAPDSYGADATDCDDGDRDVHPGADEPCDGVDNDCNGVTDDAMPAWYADRDDDGYGDPAAPAFACDVPEGYTADATDCDDAESGSYPGAPELCDDADDDCDGLVDEDAVDVQEWYADADTDGFGDAAAPTVACWQPEGHVADATDCDDAQADVHPGAEERCDGRDDDCDGAVDDEAVDRPTWYADADADGYGDAAFPSVACDAPAGTVADDTDCDDADDTVHPGADEPCDGLDQDCDGVADGAYRVPEDYTWIADAVDAAPDGATVCIAGGYYEISGAIEVVRDLSLVGRDGAAATHVYSDTSDRVLTGDGVALDIQGLSIEWGTSSSNGGCMRFWDSDVVFEDVIVQFCTGGNTGGGMYATTTDFAAYDSAFYENLASDGAFGGGGAFGVSDGNVTLANVDVIGNFTTGSFGCGPGGFGVWGTLSAYTLSMTNTVVAWNGCYDDGGYGFVFSGGVYSTANLVEMENVTFADNIVSTTATSNGVAYTQSGSWLTMTNVAVVNNMGSGDGSAIALYGVPATITYCDVYGNSGSAYGGDASDPTGTDGNVSVAPDFVRESTADPEDVDLRLNATSPLIDAGDPAILDADGTTSDIGAFGGPSATP